MDKIVLLSMKKIVEEKMNHNSENYLWKELPGETFFRIQTNDRCIADKLKREKFHLIGTGLNCKLWIFRFKCKNTKNALLILQGLTGTKSIKFDAGEEIFFSEGISSLFDELTA